MQAKTGSQGWPGDACGRAGKHGRSLVRLLIPALFVCHGGCINLGSYGAKWNVEPPQGSQLLCVCKIELQLCPEHLGFVREVDLITRSDTVQYEEGT